MDEAEWRKMNERERQARVALFNPGMIPVGSKFSNANFEPVPDPVNSLNSYRDFVYWEKDPCFIPWRCRSLVTCQNIQPCKRLFWQN